MVKDTTTSVVAVNTVALVERYQSTLYPVDLLELLRKLPEKGWIVPKRVSDTEPFALEASPSKGSLRLRVDAGNKLLGVIGEDLQQVLKGFREVRELALNIAPLAPEVKTDYVEFRYVGLLKGRKNPVTAFANYFNDSKQFGSIADALGKYLPVPTSLGAYGVRVAPKELDANRPDWADLAIYPTSIYGNSLYHFDLLYRNASRQTVERVAEDAHNVLEIAVRHIEESEW